MSDTPLESTSKLSLKQLFGFCTGIIPGTLITITFTLCYIEFFLVEVGLHPLFFIVGMVIYSVVNSFNDPLLGHLSDRTNREKWGSRRKIYLKYGAPILGVLVMLIWIPWSYTNQILIFLHFVVTLTAYETMMTLVMMCWAVLLPEMTRDVHERNKANFLCLIFALFAGFPVMMMPGLMRLGSPQLGYLAFQIANLIIVGVSLGCYGIVLLTCDERPEFQQDKGFPLITSIKESLKHKSFLMHVGFNFCTSFNSSIGLSFLFVYANILGGGVDFATIMAYLIAITVGFSASFFCLKLRSKWGMRKIVLRFGALQVISNFVVFFLILNPLFQPLIWFGFIISTFLSGGTMIFLSTFLYIVMDDDELKHGSRREGMFFGMNALFTKPADSVGPIFAVVFLMLIGYNPKLTFQLPTTIVGIKILFLIVPAIVLSISLVFMYFYPLHGERFKKLEADLEKLHAEKREKVTA